MADYSEQQLMAALRKADAAGDEAAARAIAKRIKSARQPKTVEELTPGLSTNPAEGRGNFMAGVGKSLRDTGLGLTQAAADGGIVGSVGRSIAGGLGIDMPRSPLAEWADRKIAQNQDADRALTDTRSGFLGNVTGVVGQILGPGGVMKLATRVPQLVAQAPRLGAAASAFLPTSLRGAAVQGAVLGSIQPVAEGQSRVVNTAVGTAGGALGAALPRVAGAALRGVNRIREPLTERGLENVAARTIQRFAQNPQVQQLTDPILGRAPTLAEATLDPGIAQLQRMQATKSPEVANALYGARVAANEGRVAALQPFAGTPAAREAAMAGIESAENAAYGKVRQATGVNVAPVVQKIEAVLAGPEGKRAAVRSAMNDVRRALYVDGQEGTLETSANQLLGARGVIQDLIAGGGENQSGRLAQRELLDIRKALDDAIAERAPEMTVALDARRLGMRPVNEMDTVSELIQRATKPFPTQDGGMARGLLPDAFLRPTEDLDKLARLGTGFRKAQADNVLSPQAQDAIEGIRIGLARQQFADNAGKVAGSPTAQFLAGQNIADALLGQPKGMLSGVSNMVAAALDKPYALVGVPQRLEGIMARVLTNPAEAQAILARLPAPDRVIVEQAIGRLSAPAGAGAAVASNR
jgi:hypothetical protein